MMHKAFIITTTLFANIYLFHPEDLDNDDVISAVEQTPTYKRTREILNTP